MEVETCREVKFLKKKKIKLKIYKNLKKKKINQKT